MSNAATRSAQPASYTPDVSVSEAPPATRIDSLDIVRGLVMVLMAIDHVRVYAGVPAGGPEPGVFFTRWVTHFVAPGFAFFAGTAAFLHGARLPDRASLSRFLVTRGLWLVLLELTVIRAAWTWNGDVANYNLAGVIWMLGWCMVAMGALVHLPVRAIAGAGIAIVALHNLVGMLAGGLWESANWLLRFLYFGGVVNVGGEGAPPIFILYVLAPWLGLMMAGYAFGAVMQMPTERRRELSIRIGSGLVAAFIALRVINAYGDQRPWSGEDMHPVLSFLNTSKYPASLQFLLMTMGPLLILLGLAERWRGRAAAVLGTFGRVPLFYYLLHIPVIHGAAALVSLVREGRVNPWLFGNHPLMPGEVPDGYRWSLLLLYAVTAACVAALWFPCRGFAALRSRKRSAWLSYL